MRVEYTETKVVTFEDLAVGAVFTGTVSPHVYYIKLPPATSTHIHVNAARLNTDNAGIFTTFAAEAVVTPHDVTLLVEGKAP